MKSETTANVVSGDYRIQTLMVIYGLESWLGLGGGAFHSIH